MTTTSSIFHCKVFKAEDRRADTHECEIQLLVELPQFIIDPVGFLTKVEVILLFGINERVPNENHSLRVAEVGDWVQQILQFYYHFLLYLAQFIKIEDLR